MITTRSRIKRKRVVKLRAIDDERFVYSSPEPVGQSETPSEYESRILSNFVEYFPEFDVIKTLPQYYRLLAMNKVVKEWHVAWNSQNSIESSAPNWLPTGVEDLKAWASLKKDLETLKSQEKGFSAKIDKASAALKEVVEKVGIERRAVIANLNPLIKINRISVNELPMDQQLRLAMIVDDFERKELSKDLVVSYQEELYRAFKAGLFTDPFQ